MSERREEYLQPCGTWAACQRHIRRGEPVDDACRAASTAHVREWRNNKAQEKLHAQRASDLRQPGEGEIK